MKYFDLKTGFTCNNNCVHCVVTDKKNTKDLSTDDIKKIIYTVSADFIIGFTGGEATIRSDFIELLQYAKDTGHSTALQTNGTQFADWDFAVDVSKHLDHVLIAIHSHVPEIHNSIVRSEGMYEKTIEGFKNIIKLRIDCSTQTVISKLNIKHLLETYDFIQNIKPGITMSMTYPHPNGNAFINADVVVPRFIDIHEYLQKILHKYSKILRTEAIPLCYLYPYQDDVLNFDNELNNNDRPGFDPANKNNEFFDKNGITRNYSLSMLNDKRKGPKCLECIFNNKCVGVWKEYIQIHGKHFDLYPIIEEQSKVEYDDCDKEENEISDEWGALIVYSDNAHCMNRCTFCSGTVPPAVPNKFEEIISNANYFLNKGIRKIEISGGDPGEYARIVEVIQHLTNNGAKAGLSTHGRTLKDENFVMSLKKAGLFSVRVPLYGSIADIHNKTSQYENTPGNGFNDTVQGLKNCVKYGIPIFGYILINQYNKEDINNIIKLYIDIAGNLLHHLYIGITFISQLNYEYTGNWFLPIKDLGPYIKNIYYNHPALPESTELKFLDIPYCVLGEYTELIENQFAGFPNLGKDKVSEQNRSTFSDKIPHYRIKSYFHECEKCIYNDVCGAIPLNEIKMFGTYGLEAFIDNSKEP